MMKTENRRLGWVICTKEFFRDVKRLAPRYRGWRKPLEIVDISDVCLMRMLVECWKFRLLKTGEPIPYYRLEYMTSMIKCKRRKYTVRLAQAIEDRAVS